jgi:hypothetical protein
LTESDKVEANNRPTLKPASTLIKNSAPVQIRDVYIDTPSRPVPIYSTPEPNTPATKCRRETCLIPDCIVIVEGKRSRVDLVRIVSHNLYSSPSTTVSMISIKISTEISLKKEGKILMDVI